MEKLYITKQVGITALKLFIRNANLDVGAVTTRHIIFSEIITQIRCGKGVSDAKKVFKLCFGNNNVYGRGKETYESPLMGYYYIDSAGIECVKISPRLADLVYKEVKLMELTEENILAACADLTICGRMYQELTIDAAKTMYNVEIPYGEDMIHVKLNYREQEEEDFNIICDWKIQSIEDEEEQRRAVLSQQRNWILNKQTWKKFKCVNYIMNKKGSEIKREKRNGKWIDVLHVADFLHEVRLNLGTQGIEFAAELMNQKQKLPLSVIGDISSSMKEKRMKDARDLAMFFHQGFRTIQSYKTKSIADVIKSYPKDSNAADERIDGIKRDTQKMIRGISNQLRVEFRKLGLSQEEMIKVLMSVTLSAGNNAAFGHLILDTEFFNWVMTTFKDDPTICNKTKDLLTSCDIPTGTTVEFILGRAEDEDGNVAYAKEPIEGEFEIVSEETEDGEKFFAVQDIRLPEPEVDNNSLIFITKPGGGRDSYTCSHLKEISQAMLTEGNKIILVPFAENDIHDAIVLDDTIIGSFRCSFAVAGEAVVPEKLTAMYQNKRGTVEQIITSRQEGIVGEVAVVLMKDVETVKTPEIKKNIVSEYVKQQITDIMSKKKSNKLNININFGKEQEDRESEAKKSFSSLNLKINIAQSTEKKQQSTIPSVNITVPEYVPETIDIPERIILSSEEFICLENL